MIQPTQIRTQTEPDPELQAIVQEIREAWGPYRKGRRSLNGVSAQDLADRYGVSAASISHVVSGRNWKNVA